MTAKAQEAARITLNITDASKVHEQEMMVGPGNQILKSRIIDKVLTCDRQNFVFTNAPIATFDNAAEASLRALESY